MVRPQQLPPDTSPNKDEEPASHASKWVAKWMDDLIRIPGTNFKIGLDPILGLFPSIGDLITNSAGIILILDGLKSRLPLSILMRMGMNVLLNTAIGCIPFVGDFFSACFKSNRRNLQLINRWKDGDSKVQVSSRIFISLFLVVWGLLIATILRGWYLLLQWIFGA